MKIKEDNNNKSEYQIGLKDKLLILVNILRKKPNQR